MEIKQYYFAVYSKALLEENEASKHDDDYISTILDNTVFYEKRFYLAHIKESTYENSEPEELSFLAKDDNLDESDEKDDNTLDEGEWIENICESKVVCTHPETGKEVDGIQYLEEKGLYYDLSETGMIKFSSWCNKEDIFLERPEALSVAKGDGERWISVGGSQRR